MTRPPSPPGKGPCCAGGLSTASASSTRADAKTRDVRGGSGQRPHHARRVRDLVSAPGAPRALHRQVALGSVHRRLRELRRVARRGAREGAGGGAPRASGRRRWRESSQRTRGSRLGVVAPQRRHRRRRGRRDDPRRRGGDRGDRVRGRVRGDGRVGARHPGEPGGDRSAVTGGTRVLSIASSCGSRSIRDSRSSTASSASSKARIGRRRRTRSRSTCCSPG
jgi:hypothetical protein